MRPNKMLNSAFKTHLSAALGYYHHLLFRLQHEFALHLDGIMDFCYLPDHKSRAYMECILHCLYLLPVPKLELL